jgi:phosphohistidine phosphatase
MKMSKSTKKTWIFMRHAKSSWSDESLSDHERPLNDRGMAAAPRIARWLIENGYQPDSLLCSSARRTVETAELLKNSGLKLPGYNPMTSLYLASASSILESLSEACYRTSNCSMIIGHNPGLEELVSLLAQRPISMPTAAVAVFEIDGRGEAFKLGKSRVELHDFVVPRGLDPTLAGD